MTVRRAFLVLSLLVLSALSAGIARAQTPIGPPRIDLATTGGSHFLESVAVDGQGNVTLLWEQDYSHFRYGRRFSGADTPLGSDFVLTKSFTFEPRAAANERGDTVMIWSRDTSATSDQVLVRRLSPVLPAITVATKPGRPGLRGLGDVDIDRNGRFVAVWIEGGDTARIHGQRFNADGTRRGAEFTIEAPGFETEPRVAMNHLTGDFVVLWMAYGGLPYPYRIFGQPVSFDTGRPGARFQVNTTSLGLYPSPDIGCADDGSCVVLWQVHRQSTAPNPLGSILAQRLGPDGQRLGGETLVGRTPTLTRHASLAVAPQGYFVVAWNAEKGSPMRLRLFRRDGTPAGPERELAPTAAPAFPELAFAWDGTFVLAWTDFLGHLRNHVWEVNYQRFEVPPGL